MGYEPLETMITTGPARLDRDGALTSSGEYVAALYESYAADYEWNDAPVGRTLVEHAQILRAMSWYAHVAQELAEDLWQRDCESVQEEYTGLYEVNAGGYWS